MTTYAASPDPAAGYRPQGSPNGLPAAVPVPPPPGQRDRLPRLARPRHPARAVAGALLVLVCGISSAAVATSGDHRVRVLALARDVQAGHVINAGDLTVAEISGSGVQAIGAGSAGTLVGQTAAVSLPAGTLLNPGMTSNDLAPDLGQQLVAVAVKTGGVPEQATPGRLVSLLHVTAPGGQTTTPAQVLVARALLVSVSTDDSSGAQVLSVQVPQDTALAVAQASAAGEVAVTLLPDQP